MGLHIVVLAAGKGKRMHSALPKVLQPLGDRPLLKHVVEAAQALDPQRIHVVYGHGAEQVQSALGYLDVNWVYQAQQLGTGHAVAQAIDDVTQITITRDLAQKIKNQFGLTTEAQEFFGLTFEECCQQMSAPENGGLDEWKDWYESTTGEKPTARDSKVGIIRKALKAFLISDANAAP